ncbi:MAG: hypothetical protein CFE46_12175 [Burkholderiales bacterium PBB6]|nr:MAG: hypothetical protein CFE46_12175 [Burkholderiales bacterium PBB6]
MTPELARRCELFLFCAMAAAVGAGLWVVPAFDIFGALQRLQAPFGLIAAVSHVLLAWLSGELVLARLARRHHSAWQRRAVRAGLVVLVMGAMAVWMSSLWHPHGADARALLWLQSLPLWLWPAGLMGPRQSRLPQYLRDAQRDMATATDSGQHLQHDTGSMQSAEINRVGHMALMNPNSLSGFAAPAEHRRDHQRAPLRDTRRVASLRSNERSGAVTPRDRLAA